MLKNHIEMALRNLRKNKTFSTINIVGLAAGMATCLLIVLYIGDELSYDKFYKNANRIYRINNEVKFGDNHFDLAQVPAAMGPTLKREFPQVEQYTRFRWHGGLLIKNGNENIRENKVIYADSTLLNIFSLELLSGNFKNILTEPYTLLINESTAKKYFNRTNVTGESMLINNSRRYRISGVIKDLPYQSHFNYDFFVAMAEYADSRNDQDWLSQNYNTYILVDKATSAEMLALELDKLVYRKVGPFLKGAMNLSLADFKQQGGFIKNTLTPLTSIHLYSNKMGELNANGSYLYVYIFSAIGVFILLIACINFMNLSTAKSANHAREVGVRKMLGSLRKNLISKFLIESLLVSFISLMLSVVIAAILLPLFNSMAEKQLDIAILFQPLILLSAVLLVFVVGIFAGSYPAFFLSSFSPVDVLKGKFAIGFKGSGLRNGLVIFQFAVSIILISGTIVIYNQLEYIRNKNIGYNRDKLLTIHNTGSLKANAQAFKNELKNISGISNVTMTSYLPIDGNRNSDVFFTSPALEQKTSIIMQKWLVDENYVPTLDIKLATGRNISTVFSTDSNAIVINETAADFLGGGDLLNKRLYHIPDVKSNKVEVLNIVGIVKNFNFNSLHDLVSPLALSVGKDGGSVTVRLNTENVSGVLAEVKSRWQSMTQNEPLTYSFMDEKFNNQYSSEKRTGKIFLSFATLAIFIACLGLFGLAAYAAEQRNKEIGIRKVLGATVLNITSMLSRDFLKLVVIASLISFPLAWFVMNKWLQDFAYRVNISWWMFVVAGIVALIIAILTVISQAIKTAISNPIKSLRTE